MAYDTTNDECTGEPNCILTHTLAHLKRCAVHVPFGLMRTHRFSFEAQRIAAKTLANSGAGKQRDEQEGPIESHLYINFISTNFDILKRPFQNNICHSEILF